MIHACLNAGHDTCSHDPCTCMWFMTHACMRMHMHMHAGHNPCVHACMRVMTHACMHMHAGHDTLQVAGWLKLILQFPCRPLQPPPSS